MSGVTWTVWNRLEANLNSQSLSKATWYRLTQDVWKTIEAVRDDCSNAYVQQLLAANQPIVVVVLTARGLIAASLLANMTGCC